MKKLIFILPLAFGLLIQTVSAQETASKGSGIPTVNIKGLNGAVVSTDKITNDGKPIILSFWATWCKPCIQEMPSIERAQNILRDKR